MRQRNEEYWDLVGELSQLPEQLEGSVERARKRARRAAPLRRLAVPAASFAGLAAAFVLLVNISVPFALACSGVPLLRELTAAVALSPSLSAAVAHDYVQYIGQSQTVDGVTVHLEYAIVDPVQAVFFYSVDGGRFWASPKLTDPRGEHIGGYGTSSSMHDGPEGLDSMTLSFTGDGGGLPERFTMDMYFQPRPEQDQRDAPAATSDMASPEHTESSENPREDPDALRFTFDIALDPARISQGRSVDVGRWLELDGQRILIDRLELFPTRTVVYLGEDSANSAWLRTLKFFFTDGEGNTYDNIDGTLSASGAKDSKSYLTYYFQSFYYAAPERLSLHVTKAQWLDKDADRVTLDLITGACTGLPEGVEVDKITREKDFVTVQLLATAEHKQLGQIFAGPYWDPEGGEHSINQWGFTNEYDETDEQIIATIETIFLSDYPWDTVELELNFTRVSQYGPALTVPLFSSQHSS